MEGGSFCVNPKHPYLTFEKQLRQLENRGIIVNDKSFAINALQNFSYYSLSNGYKDLFLASRSPEKFKDGTTFEMLYTANWLDLSMSNILFKYSLIVEKQLKTAVSHVVAKSFSIEETRYLNPKNYSTTKAQRGKFSDVQKAIDEAKYKNPVCKYYMDTEDNLPPWIAIQGISFGSAVNWYSILRGPHKLEVIDSFLNLILKSGAILKLEDRKHFFKICLEQVYEFRNLSAHGNRTFKLQLPEKQRQVPRYLKSAKLDKYYPAQDGVIISRDSIFSIIMSLLILINDAFVSRNLINELDKLFEFYADDPNIFIDSSIYDLFGLEPNFIEFLVSFFNYKYD